MDNVVGTATIVIRPEMTRFEAELEAKSAPALGGFQKKAETAGKGGGERLSKGFKGGLGGIETALGAAGVPLQTFGGRLDKTAASMSHVDSAGSKLNTTLAALGGKALVGTTAAVVGLSAAGVVLALKQEKVSVAIANSANISKEAGKQISDSFLTTVSVGEFSGRELGNAYAGVAGVLGELQGHALGSSEAVKFMAASEDLATGAQIELGNATSDLTKTMQAYHINVEGAAGASDILFNTSRVTGIQMDQLTSGLSRMKGQLGALAPSLKESAGWLDALAKAGITGRPAMSALSTSLSTLVGGGTKTTEMAKKLGLEIYDSSHKFVGMRSILEQLSPKLHELGQEQQIEATKALFGGKANRQLLDIILEGPHAFDKHTQAVSRSGAAHEAAAAQAETFEGKIKRLEKEVINLATRFGQVLVPVLSKVVGAISTTIGWFEKHTGAAKSLAFVIGSVLGLAITVFVTQKVQALVNGVKAMIGSFVALAGKVTGTAAVVGTESVAMTEATSTAGTAIEFNNRAVAGSFAGIGGAAGTATATVETEMGAMAAGVASEDEAIIASNEAAGASFTAMLGPIGAVVAALVAAQPLINELTGGGLGETEAEGGKAGASKGGLKTQHSGPGGGSTYYGLPQGESVEKTIFDFFSKAGFTSAGAAGIVGNFSQESSLKSTLDSKEGFGLASWTNERKAELAAYAKSVGLPATAVTAQLNFVLKELNSRPDLKKQLEHTSDPKKAAELFNKGFEGGTDPAGKREKFAAEALSKNAGKHASATEKDTHALHAHNKALEESIKSLTSPASKKAGIGTKAKASGYVDPFAGASGLVRGREDEGIDFTAKVGSKIGAIGEGFIDKIVANWYKGQPLIEEKLTSGSHKGQHVYYAEQINSSVREGQRVRAGQQIGTVARSGTGLELGFGAGGGRTLAQATTGYKEGEKTPAAAAFSKFLAEVGKGGTKLQQASAVFESVAKAELKKQTADQKTGQSTLQKMLSAIHSGNLHELTKVVGGSHDKALHVLEKKLHDDHTTVLEKLRKQLVDAHTKALAALNKALIKAAEKASAERMSHEDTIHTDEADAAATAIADATRVALDHAAEAGKAGAELIAAQAQSHLDEVKAADDAAVGAAKLAVDRATGMGEAAEAAAKQQLVNAENQAKVSEASAQQTLDLANNAASEAQKATEADEKRKREGEEADEKRKREEESKGIGGTPAAGPAGQFTFYINGANLSAAEVMAEVGWALKTGTLPEAPPTAPHPVAA